MKHTPPPWRVRKNRDESDCFVQGPQPEDMAYAPEIMGDDYNGFGDYEAKLADAELIVRAVNSHGALVSALEDAKRWHQGDKWRSVAGERKEAWQAHMDKIDAALLLAKGELDGLV